MTTEIERKYYELDKQFPRVRLLRDICTNNGQQFKLGSILRTISKRHNGLTLTDGNHLISEVGFEIVQLITEVDDIANELAKQNARKYRDRHFASWRKQ